MGSTQARKSRKRLYQAKLHQRKKLVHSALSPELKSKLKTKRNSVSVRKGDTVRITTGGSRGKTGKVLAVELSTLCVYVEGITKRNSKGIEKPVPIHPSNLEITDGTFDGWRKKILER